MQSPMAIVWAAVCFSEVGGDEKWSRLLLTRQAAARQHFWSATKTVFIGVSRQSFMTIGDSRTKKSGTQIETD